MIDFNEEQNKEFHNLVMGKIPGKIHYSSSPDRGLENLLYLLPWIQEKVQGIKLHVDVYYGFENISKMNPELAKKLEALVKTAGGEGVVNFKGRVGQEVLAEAWKKASLWFYPAWFSETYCCDANTWIHTKTGKKKITDVQVGDYVMTHTGQYQKVLVTMVNPAKENLNKIHLKYLPEELLVTKNHPILRLPKEKARCGRYYTSKCSRKKDVCHGYDYKVKGKSYSNNTDCYRLEQDFDLAWEDSSVLRPGDYVAFPRNQKRETPKDLFSYLEGLEEYRKDGMSKPIENFQLDEDFLTMLGWYTAEGNFDGRSIVNFSLNISESEEAEFISNQLRRMGLSVRIDQDGSVRRVVTHCAILGRMLESNFGKGARSKRIPEWIKDLGETYVMAYLKGLYGGDGHIGKTTLKIEAASKELIWDVNECLVKFAIISSITYGKKSNIKRKGDKILKAEGLSEFYSITTSFGQGGLVELFQIERETDGRDDLCLFDSRYVYYPVREVSEVPSTDGKTYNLEVDIDNSYIANGVVVHNCITANEAMLSATPILCSDEAALNTTVGKYGIRVPGYAHSKESREQYLLEAIRLFNDKDHWMHWARMSYAGSLTGIDWESRYNKYWDKLLP